MSKNENVIEITRPQCSSTVRVYESELFQFNKSHEVSILNINKGYRYKEYSFCFTPNAIVENDEDCWDLIFRFRKSEISNIVNALIKEHRKEAFQNGKIEMQNQLKTLLFGE